MQTTGGVRGFVNYLRGMIDNKIVIIWLKKGLEIIYIFSNSSFLFHVLHFFVFCFFSCFLLIHLLWYNFNININTSLKDRILYKIHLPAREKYRYYFMSSPDIRRFTWLLSSFFQVDIFLYFIWENRQNLLYGASYWSFIAEKTSYRIYIALFISFIKNGGRWKSWKMWHHLTSIYLFCDSLSEERLCVPFQDFWRICIECVKA